MDCAVGKANQPSSNEETESHKQETSTLKRYRRTIVQGCFICKKGEPVEDEYDSNEYPHLAKNIFVRHVSIAKTLLKPIDRLFFKKLKDI
jgi:hypothetical protein